MVQQNKKQTLTEESQLDAILQDYMEQIDRGIPVDQKAIIAANPELADLLNNFFAIEADVKQMAGPLFSELELENKTGNSEQATSRIDDVFAKTYVPKPGTESFSSGIPEKFGRYKIIKQLGAGAMGEVYLAEDTELHRQVALKIPLFDDPKNTELAERFHREARSSAILRHANICPVYDVGELEGVRYISMAYIEGAPLSDLLKSPEPVPQRRVAYLIRKLALGLTDAHEQTIIHRDLKPANIMLDKKGEPVVMDFGLACITNHSESARITRSGQILGTPAYMPPEQIEADLSKIGPGCDIYSLGVIFYELLAGQLPFQGSVASVLGQIMTQDAKPPHEVRPEVNADLEAICMKMMSKTIADRQTSMKEVARDLLRWLKENPAAGQAATPQEKTPTEPKEVSESKESETDQSIHELTASSHGVLLDMTRKLLEKHDYEQVVQLADKIPEKRQTPELLELFDKGQKLSDEVAYLSLSIQELRAKKDYHGLIPKLQEYLKLKPRNRKVKKLLEEVKEKARYTAKQDDGNAISNSMLRWISEDITTMIAVGLIAFGMAFAGITMYLRSGGRTIQVNIDDPAAIISIDGKQISIKGKSGTTRLSIGERKVTVTLADGSVVQGWDQFVYTVKKGKNVPLSIRVLPQKPPERVVEEKPSDPPSTLPLTWNPRLSENVIPGFIARPALLPGLKRWQAISKVPASVVRCIAYSPDRKEIACGCESGLIRIYNSKTLQLTRVITGHAHGISSIAYRPDGQQIASVGRWDNTVRLWSSTDGTPGPILVGHTNVVHCVAYSPDGLQIASGSWDNTVRLWSLEGTPGPILAGHTGPIRSVTYRPDGQQIASAGHDETVRLWSIKGIPGLVLKGHTDKIASVSYSTNGKQLVSGSWDGTIRLWSVNGTSGPILDNHSDCVRSVTYSPDGQQIASASYDGTVRLWSTEGVPGPILGGHTDHVRSVVYRPDGQQIASASYDGTVRFWSVDGTSEATLAMSNNSILSVAYRPDGKQISSTGLDNNVRLWSVNGAPGPILEGHTDMVQSVAYHPDGKQIATASCDNTIRLWSPDGTAGPILKGHTAPVRCISYRPDGLQIASAGDDTSIRLWSADGIPESVLKGHTDFVSSVNYRPDGQQIASGSNDSTVRLWSLNGNPGPIFNGHSGGVTSVKYHPNGMQIASAGSDKMIRLWKLDGTSSFAFKGQKSLISSIAYHPSGQQIASCGYDTRVRLWSVGGTAGPIFIGHIASVLSVAYRPDGQQIASAGQNGLIRLWNAFNGDPQLTILQLDGNRSATFSAAGELLHGEPDDLNNDLYYIVETNNGTTTILTPSQFYNKYDKNKNRTFSNTNPPTHKPDGPPGEVKKLTGRADGIKLGQVSSNLTPTEIITSTDWKWTEPVNLGEQINTIYREDGSCLSADGLTLYFHSDRPGGEGDIDLYQAVRKSLDQPFGKPTNLGPLINSSERDQGPAVSTDGLTMLFYSKRSGTLGTFDIWQSNRSSTDQPFGKPVNMGTNINTSSTDSHPSLSPDGKTLVFVSRRPGSLGNADFYISTRNSPSEKFGNAVHLPHLSSNTGEYWTRFTPDGRALLFGSLRPPNLGGEDFWVTKRTNNGEFETPVYLESPLNSSASEGAAAFTPNGQTVIFDSARPGGLGKHDLWMSHRVPKKISP